MSAVEPISNRTRTKIVATVGPACSSLEMLGELVGAGVDVFRVNMAHGSRSDHEQALASIREASRQGERPIGILVDLAGPKIRLGEISPDPIHCKRDAIFRFVREPSDEPNTLTSSYERLVDELDPGDRILLADGTVEMRVVESSHDEAVCRVVGPGKIRSRQGINLPGVKLSVASMDEEDLDNARWAAANDVDFVSLSFVRKPADILQLRELLRSVGSPALAISKIEKPEALKALDEIVCASDGIMIARGDLGVEIDVAEMPVKQKQIIESCRQWKKPVIVATQMLDSMQRATHPTRAEVTDVANAILDGADACMLSGETAVGDYPIESVQMMNRVMLATERYMAEDIQRYSAPTSPVGVVHPITSAVVAGAGQIARRLDAKMVVIATRSGRTALTKAKQRDFIPTVAVSDQDSTLRQMCLYWGINPLAGAPEDMDRDLIPFIDQWGRASSELQSRDRIVIMTGTKVREGAHNQLVVHEVE